MQSQSKTPAARPGFRAVLTPHRSLGKAGFIVLMSAVALVSFVAGMIFYAIGAWPVMGFFGLDVALVYAAFHTNYRSARTFELVELTEEGLALSKVATSGEATTWHFNPYWVRLDLSERPSGECALTLSSAGRTIRLARELSDPERRDFASALSRALAGWRGALR